MRGYHYAACYLLGPPFLLHHKRIIVMHNVIA